MWRIVLYFTGVIYTAYVAIMHEESMLVTLLIFELLFPFLLFILNLIQLIKVKVSLHIPIPVVEKGEESTFYVQVENPTFLPIHYLVVTFNIQNSISHKKIKSRVKGNAAHKQIMQFPIQLEGSSCGNFELSIYKIRLYDYLRLFSLTKRCKNTKKDLSILPELYETQIILSEYTKEFPLESDIYDPHKSGDDPSEIFQIREYREGDRLQAVHWKRSACDDSLMVKEYSRALGYPIIFLLNQPETYRGTSYEAFFEVFYSLSAALLSAECIFYIAWYDSVLQDITRLGIEDLESLYSFVSILLKTVPSYTSTPLSLLYQEKYRGETFCTLLELDANLLLKKNEFIEVTFEADKLKENLSSYSLTI